MNWKARIAADSAVLAGKPIIKGTRLSVDFILSLFAEGWTEQESVGQLSSALSRRSDGGIRLCSDVPG